MGGVDKFPLNAISAALQTCNQAVQQLPIQICGCPSRRKIGLFGVSYARDRCGSTLSAESQRVSEQSETEPPPLHPLPLLTARPVKLENVSAPTCPLLRMKNHALKV